LFLSCTGILQNTIVCIASIVSPKSHIKYRCVRQSGACNAIGPTTLWKGQNHVDNSCRTWDRCWPRDQLLCLRRSL